MQKIKAYTLAETLITIILVGVIASVMMVHFRPKNLSNEALQKAGVNMYSQIDFAFKNLLARKSKSYTMSRLITADNSAEFSITDEDADEKLIAILKKTLVMRRKPSISEDYLKKTLIDDVGITYKTADSKDLTGEYFTQKAILKNGTIFLLHLNESCDTVETTIFNPERKTRRTIKNSCGLIFYDVNGEDNPNILGLDQYIISIGKLGIK